MANKHSRQGLALGVSLAMGSTLISGLPAAADYQDLTIQLAQEDTNGVLATTMGYGDFELETEWDLSINDADLAYLRYELTFTSSDGSNIDSKGDINQVSWDAAEDDVDVNYPEEWDASFASGDSILRWAPAYVLADDERVDYTYNIEHTNSGAICGTGTLEARDSNVPPQDYSYKYYDADSDAGIDMQRDDLVGTSVVGVTECYPGSNNDIDDFSGEAETHFFNVTFSAGTGFAGEVDAPAPNGFEALLYIEDANSNADWVDVEVFAWLDKDTDGVVDPTESYSAPVTVRFWNPDALTASLSVDETWVCETADNTAGGCSVNFTDANPDYFNQEFTVTVDQELNTYYASTEDFDDLFKVFNYVDNLNAGEPMIRNGNVAFDGYFDDDADNDGNPDDPSDPTISWQDWSGVAGAYYNDIDEDDFLEWGEEGSGFQKEAKHFTTFNQTIPAQLNYEVDSDDNHIGLVHINDVDAVATDVAINDGYEDDGEWAFLYWLNIMDGTYGYNYRHITASGATGAVVEETLVNAKANVSTYKDDAIVRIDDETVTYVVTVTGGVAGDDVEIIFNIGGTMSVNGEDFTTGTSRSVEGVLDANRAFTLSIVNDDPTVSDYLDITDVKTQTQLLNNFGASTNTFEIDWDASAWALTADRLFDGEATVQVGSTFNMLYTVEDQWSQVPGAGLAVVEFDAAGVGGLANRNYGSFSPDFNVSNGAFTVSLPDTNPAAGEGRGDFALKLYTRASTSVGYAIHSTTNVSVWYLNDVAVDEVSIPGGQDTTANVAYVSAADLVADDAANFNNGYIENAAGVELSGHLVTVSGPGVLFKSGTLSGTGSLTFYTDRDGKFSFMAAHTLVGTHTVTITSGGKSTTETFTITSASVRAQNVALSAFDGKAGTVSDLHATVTDTYGNLVDAGTSVTFRRTAGAGYFVPTNGDYAYPVQVTSTTAANGVATAQLVVLPGEVGFSTTVNASIVHETGGQTVAAQRTAGDTLSGSIQPHAWTKLQDDGTVKMYAKNIVGVGKVQFFHNGGEIAWVRAADALNPKLREANGAYYLVRTRDLLEGKNVFEIYIDGERVRRTAYSK